MGLLDLFRSRPSRPEASGDPARIAEAQAVLEELRPLFRADGGDMVLVAVHDDGRIELEPVGACHGCSVSRLTLDGAVRPRLAERLPWFGGLVVAGR